jgi:putative component of toxin-antitoxin plasmid stabilization module
MRYRIVKDTNFSGREASVYTIKELNTNETLLEQFINDNISSSSSEINNILIRLKTIGHKTGARENFFKHKEGIPGDGVCALYDIPGSKLRLYCIRYGMNLIILGGGGVKSKQISALQEDELLTDANYFLKQLSKDIKSRTDSKEICFTNEGMDLEGNLNFYDDEN